MIDLFLYWLFGIGSSYTVAIAPVVLAALIASGASAASSIGQSVYGSVQNNRLSRGQKQQNAFNAQQAELQRQWEEHMHNRELEEADTAFQRQTKDMLSAGVNPAILYGSGAGSGAPTASIGSGAAASGSYTPSSLNFPDLGSMLMNIQRQSAEIKNIEADTLLKKSEATGQDIQNQYAESYWKNQVGIMEASRSKIIADAKLTEQKLRTEEYETAIKANGLDTTWLESQVKMYELFMTKIDYKAKDEIVNLQLDCMRAAAAKDQATVDVLVEQIGEVVARAGLAMKQAGYFKQLGREQEAVADFWSSAEGKEALKKSAEGSAEKSYREGKFAKYGVWLNGIGNFLKDVGIGVGAAMSVKNLKGALAAQQVVPSNVEPNYNIPGL